MMTSAISAMLLLAGSQGAPVEVTDANYSALRDAIRQQQVELTYTTQRWVLDHRDGPEMGTRTANPMILWVGNGHTLGQTSTYGVLSRLQVWSDPEIKALFPRFFGVSEDVNAIANTRSWMSDALKKKIVDAGGEGVFVIAPGSKILAGTTSADPRHVAVALQEGLKAWMALGADERAWSADKKTQDSYASKQGGGINGNNPNGRGRITIDGNMRPTNRPNARAAGRGEVDGGTTIIVEGSAIPPPPGTQPSTGASQGRPNRNGGPNGSGRPSVLNSRIPITAVKLWVTARDLPRTPPSPTPLAYNLVPFWTTSNLLIANMGNDPRAGQTYQISDAFVKQLFSQVLIDNVRGQGMGFAANEQTVSKMAATISAVDANFITLRIGGNFNASASGYWSLEPGKAPSESIQNRGIDLTLLGKARYDRKKGEFVQLEFVAAGKRWGGSPLNGRLNDSAPQPIGFFGRIALPTPFESIEPMAMREKMQGSKREW